MKRTHSRSKSLPVRQTGAHAGIELPQRQLHPGNLFNVALDHHRAGRFAQAESGYQQVIAANPTHADAWYFLGAIAHQNGRNQAAIELICKAIGLDNCNTAYHLRLAAALQACGRLQDAEAGYRRALTLDPQVAEANYSRGVTVQKLGNLAEAQVCYRRTLALDPAHAGAHMDLANGLFSSGNTAEALVCFQRALLLLPDVAEAHYNFGNVLVAMGKFADAELCYRRSLAIHPNRPLVHNNLGVALTNMGRLDEAEICFRRALELAPELFQSQIGIGEVLKSQGKLTEAELSFRRALQVDPFSSHTHYNLAVILQALNRSEEAKDNYQKCVALEPAFMWAHYNLGAALEAVHNNSAAEVCYRRALVLKPNLTEAHTGLANVLLALGRLPEAEVCYRQALAQAPYDSRAHYNLAVALLQQGKLVQAELRFREAQVLRPDCTDTLTNLGSVLLPQGKLHEAIACYERALVLDPELPKAFSGLLLSLNYISDISNERVRPELTRWNEQIAARYRPAQERYENERSGSRRLRIGYVSPDFRAHSVAYFLEPLLRFHDHGAVEVFCYADVGQPDAVTHRFRALADHWTTTVAMSDDAMADRIRQDKIDILVDLAGHTRGNRLLVFARKPAPVQVTWLGYPNTTGLSTMDYRLVDAITDPPDQPSQASEMLVRIEGGFVCYGPPTEAPHPAPPPSLINGVVTFGSFNNLAKLSDATLDIWARVMHSVAGSRLFLKSPGLSDASAQSLLQTRFGERGIGCERLILLGPQPNSYEHLGCYQQVDIALDPFPYNGTTTTCEALWMGVPVVTLRDERHAGRVGTSILARVGLDELAAHDVHDYVEIAARLSADPWRLADLRGLLRPRMRSSPLCDAPSFARKIESIYRTLWQRWYERESL